MDRTKKENPSHCATARNRSTTDYNDRVAVRRLCAKIISTNETHGNRKEAKLLGSNASAPPINSRAIARGLKATADPGSSSDREALQLATSKIDREARSMICDRERILFLLGFFRA
jgi:hypothetical protein